MIKIELTRVGLVKDPFLKEETRVLEPLSRSGMILNYPVVGWPIIMKMGRGFFFTTPVQMIEMGSPVTGFRFTTQNSVYELREVEGSEGDEVCES